MSKKTLGEKLKVSLVLFFLILTFPLTKAIGEEARTEQSRIYTTYPLSDKKDTSRYIKELQPGEDLLPGTYKAKARLSLKREIKKVPSETFHFDFPENSNTSNEKFQRGWASFEKTYFWHPSNEENVLTIPVSLKSTDEGKSITNFNEIHIDYQDLFGENPSELGIQMLVSEKKLGKTTAILGGTVGERQLTPIKKLNISSISWKEKDYSYLAKRALGLPFDDTWRHARSEANTVFQRRFHLNLDSFEAIDLVMQPGATKNQIKSLVCNFRIGFENFLTPGEILAWDSVPHKILNNQGQKILRIELGKYFQNRFGHRKGIHLEEMIFFLPGETSKILRNPILKTINFLAPDEFQPLVGVEIGKDTDKSKRISRVLLLSSHIEDLPQKRKRLVLDMRKLHDKLDGNAKFHSMTLIAQPKNPESITGFDLQSARAVSLWEEEQPVFLDKGKNLLSQWGGPFLNLGSDPQKIEWPRVHAHLSFHKLPQKGLPLIFDENQKRDVRNQPGNENLNGLSTILNDENIDKTTNKKVDTIFHFGGAEIRAYPILSSWNFGPQGLTLEGKEGGWVEISWPIQADIKKNTKFFLGITEGVQAIRSIQVVPLFSGQELQPVFGLPNHPFNIDSSVRKIDGIKIRMMLRNNHFKIKLDKSVIFQPVAVTPAQALDIPIPVRDETLLIPKNVISPSETQVTINRRNLMAILFPETNTPKTLTWTTDINQNVDGIQSVKINYQAPPTLIANHPCWLELTLVGSNYKVQKTVCPKLSSGQIVIPAHDLFYGSAIPSDAVIKFITWKVNFEDPTDSKQPFVLGMAVTLEETKFLSLRQELIQHSVLEWQDEKIFPASLDDMPGLDLLSGSNWVNLGHLTIKKNVENNPSLNFLVHPHLETQTVILEKSDPISSNEWASLMETDQTDIAPSMTMTGLSKLLPPLLTIALLWWVWKRGWNARLWKWSVFVWLRIETLCHRSFKTISEKGFLLNRVVGFTILGPGLFMIGRLIEEDTGKLILGANAFLFIGVLWHELRWWFSASQKIISKTSGADNFITSPPANQQKKNDTLFKNWMFGKNKALPPFLYLVATIGLGCVSYNLGHGRDSVLSLLPLLGVLYFYIPWISWFFKGKIRIWVTTATVLYLLGIFGLLIKWRGGADLFFSIAGIAAVLVWRNLTPHLRPKLEQRWPSLADKVYGGEGTYYISGFILTLVMAAFFLIVNLKPVAEQIAVVGYYMLVVGVFLEAKALRKGNHEPNGENKVLTTEEDTSRA